MEQIIQFILATVAAFAIGAVFYLFFQWCADDAQRRGKSALMVFLASVLFFPFGLLAWLVFRPEPVPVRERYGAGPGRSR